MTTTKKGRPKKKIYLVNDSVTLYYDVIRDVAHLNVDVSVRLDVHVECTVPSRVHKTLVQPTSYTGWIQEIEPEM